ncbi:hypothetical protein HDV00_007618 [Rhizophlyctis rosea]|nr:hypothetical protein HDV00_007618 [Rhizophlyctis rosea]
MALGESSSGRVLEKRLPLAGGVGVGVVEYGDEVELGVDGDGESGMIDGFGTASSVIDDGGCGDEGGVCVSRGMIGVGVSGVDVGEVGERAVVGVGVDGGAEDSMIVGFGTADLVGDIVGEAVDETSSNSENTTKYPSNLSSSPPTSPHSHPNTLHTSNTDTAHSSDTYPDTNPLYPCYHDNDNDEVVTTKISSKKGPAEFLVRVPAVRKRSVEEEEGDEGEWEFRVVREGGESGCGVEKAEGSPGGELSLAEGSNVGASDFSGCANVSWLRASRDVERDDHLIGGSGTMSTSTTPVTVVESHEGMEVPTSHAEEVVSLPRRLACPPTVE